MLTAWKVFKAFISTIQKYKLLDGIYPCSEFRKIIERERMRSDREGQHFSLVVFNVEKTIGSSNSTKHLINTLQHRELRLTDTIGWFDNKSIGVLLHNTGEDGSLTFVENIHSLFSTSYCLPHHTIYIYPFHGIDKSKAVATKRTRERFNVVTECLIHVNGNSNSYSYGTMLCHTANISACGALLESEDVLPVGLQIELKIVSLSAKKSGHNGEGNMAKITGTVLRTDESGLAISFDNEYDIKSIVG